MSKSTKEAVGGDEPPDAPGRMERLGVLAVRLIVVAAIVVLGIMVLKLLPEQVAVKQDPGYIDVIFASRFVVFAVRTVIIFGALYAAMSVVVLMWNYRWITSFAGVQTTKIERSVSGLSKERDRLAAQLAESEDTIEALENKLSDALTRLEQTSTVLDKALAERHSPGNGLVLRLKSHWRQRGGTM